MKCCGRVGFTGSKVKVTLLNLVLLPVLRHGLLTEPVTTCRHGENCHLTDELRLAFVKSWSMCNCAELQLNWFAQSEDIQLYVRSLNLCSIEYFFIMHRCIALKPLNQFSR